MSKNVQRLGAVLVSQPYPLSMGDKKKMVVGEKKFNLRPPNFRLKHGVGEEETIHDKINWVLE